MSETDHSELLAELRWEREQRMARWETPGDASERIAPGDPVSPQERPPAPLYEPPGASHG